MTSSTATPFEVRCDILADMYVNHKDEEGLEDFIAYNDLGLPLAFAISQGVCTVTDTGKRFVNETFDLLLTTLEIPEDEGYDSFDDLMLG